MTAIGASLCLIVSFTIHLRSQTLWGVVTRLIQGAQEGRTKTKAGCAKPKGGGQCHAYDALARALDTLNSIHISPRGYLEYDLVYSMKTQ